MILVEEWIKSPQSERQAHLRLDLPCLERGGRWEARGVLAQYLNTNIPKGRWVNLCHACNNAKCSNPQHLYWGTPGENLLDAYNCGAQVRGFKGVQAWQVDGFTGVSEDQKNKIRRALLGRKHSPERIAYRISRITGVKKCIFICPNCDKVGRGGAMKRWHFDNCKVKK